MAKRINLIFEDYECICCPKEFNYIKENFTNNILFYKSEKKFPGEIFFAFGPLRTTIIERMWFDGDDKYRYAFFLTKNHFYCFRHMKTKEEMRGRKMTETLAKAACRLNLTSGFAEVRRLIDGGGIFINDVPAKEWNQKVHQGDVIRIGKRRTGVV